MIFIREISTIYSVETDFSPKNRSNHCPPFHLHHIRWNVKCATPHYDYDYTIKYRWFVHFINNVLGSWQMLLILFGLVVASIFHYKEWWYRLWHPGKSHKLYPPESNVAHFAKYTLYIDTIDSFIFSPPSLSLHLSFETLHYQMLVFVCAYHLIYILYEYAIQTEWATNIELHSTM